MFPLHAATGDKWLLSDGVDTEQFCRGRKLHRIECSLLHHFILTALLSVWHLVDDQQILAK